MTRTATAPKPAEAAAITLARPSPGPVFVPTDRASLIVRGGTVFYIGSINHVFDDDTPVILHDLIIGGDYFIRLVDNVLQASLADTADLDGVLGGFHYAPGGNATTRAGGDDVPAINPCSCWDAGYRPSCADPRGMTCVDGKFWADIYLLNDDPADDGTSRFGKRIADGNDPPARRGGDSYGHLDRDVAVEVLAAAGKHLLSPEEFFAAAFGVTEGTSAGRDPKKTGLDALRTSRWGVMQATGNMSTWCSDGDPDRPRLAYRCGGDWDVGEFAGSRFAVVEGWPDYSAGWVGARGRSDHLQLG
jgi:hypothetical protein